MGEGSAFSELSNSVCGEGRRQHGCGRQIDLLCIEIATGKMLVVILKTTNGLWFSF